MQVFCLALKKKQLQFYFLCRSALCELFYFTSCEHTRLGSVSTNGTILCKNSCEKQQEDENITAHCPRGMRVTAPKYSYHETGRH